MNKGVMGKSLTINRSLSATLTGLSLFVLVGLMLACAETPTKNTASLPISPWGDNFLYSYDPPEIKPAASVKTTIAIVSPDYSNKSMNPDYNKVAKGLARSIAADFDKVIVAKGMTVTGPYDSLDMMAYPDKKNADLSLTPEFFFNTQSRDLDDWKNKDRNLHKTVEVRLDGSIILALREPLSSEKIWIKKIPVADLSEEAIVIAQSVPVYRKQGDFIPDSYQPGKILYDGRQDAVANMIKKLYPAIMNTAWKYLDTQEINILKEKAKEIRVKKVY
ncbi:MAG: hypothetical protein V2B20_13355 [Pseudomonadota bacterium]